jgi:predicted GH43/DUF377 family glycosyl hydrolase
MRTVEINMQRSAANPLITPKDIVPSFPNWEVLGAFNAGIIQHRDEIVMLLRVAERPVQDDPNYMLVPVLNLENGSGDPAAIMNTVKVNRRDERFDFSDPRVIRDQEGNTIYLTSISHLRVARSKDGEQFAVDARPTILPEGELESWGIEDSRITAIDGIYYLTYSAISEKGVCVGMLSTTDFERFTREGIMLAPTNKDVVIFPEKINGLYYMLHRPVPEGIGYPEMWIAQSPDLIHWGRHEFLMGLSETDARIGAGCVPIKTEIGWLILYHGADIEHRYYMGAALLDIEHPSKVIARLNDAIMIPEADYEVDGFFNSVIFACGAVVEGDVVTMYYGAADDSMGSATFSLSKLMHLLQQA